MKDLLLNVGSGGGAAAAPAAGGASGGAAAAEETKEEEKEEGMLNPKLITHKDRTDGLPQKKKSQTRTWVSAFSTKHLSSSFPFLLCLVRL